MSGSTAPPITAVAIFDGVNQNQRATVALFHASDNQSPGGNGFGILTGGVAQLLNPAGNIDRQRETGFDGIPAAGVATGTAQLSGPLLATTTTPAITGSPTPQTIALAATSFSNRGVTSVYQPGATLLVDAGLAAQEYVFVTAVSGLNVTGIFRNSHLAGATVGAFAFSQSRDATIPDGSSPAGINAGGAYLFNAGNNTVQFERSFTGELMGATGVGAAVAVEYEDTGGGPMLANGTASGLRLMPAQALMGTVLAQATVTTTTAGLTSLTFPSAAAAASITAGHAIQLTGGAAAETVFTPQSWVPGSGAVVPLQSPVVNAGQTTARWSVFGANGPALTGFLPHGIGLEEECVYDPVSGLYYLERSATQDNVAPQNVVMEAPALWNGTGMDRQPGSAARGADVNARSGFSNIYNLTAATLVKAAPGRAVRVSVVAAGTTAGSVNDAATVVAAAAGNQVASIPTTVGVLLLDWPCSAGIVVTPGTSQVLAVSYT
ncbi:MAG: hypothetical protein NVS2B11_03480 [Acetobacteraceae bacterium]